MSCATFCDAGLGCMTRREFRFSETQKETPVVVKFFIVCCQYRDFIEMFNRCWIVQLLPDTWHQIHVTGGWVGATAGGPATPHAAAAAHCDNTVFSPVECHHTALNTQSAQTTAQNHCSSTAPHASCQAGRLHSSTVPAQQQRRQGQQQQRKCAGTSISMNSSWCCNPQYKLAASGTGQVVICLGQRDPQVFAFQGLELCKRSPHSVQHIHHSSETN